MICYRAYQLSKLILKKTFLDSTPLKNLMKKDKRFSHSSGSPSLYTTSLDIFKKLPNQPEIENDLVFAIELTTWPEIIHSWLERKRHWPSSETVNEIRKTNCHFVLKSSSVNSVEDQWRISFSLAEGILSRKRNIF